MSEPVTLTWSGADALAPEVRERLMGPGGPFEIVIEDVLGAPAEVFAQRAHNLREVIENAALRHPDRVFLVSAAGEEITYPDAVRRIARVAQTLEREYGVSKGDRVGLASANTVEYVLCYWATLALGGILSNFNGWWTTPELAHGIDLTEPVVVLADARRLELLEKVPPPASGTLPPLVLMETAAAAGLAADGPDVPMPTVPIDEDDPATILFTSGTTGRSKGAVNTHRNWIHFGLTNTAAGAFGMAAAGISPEIAAKAPQPSAIFAAPIFHISGSGPLTNAPASGMKLVLPPPGRWDETVTLELVQKHRITTLSGVPTQFWRILQHPEIGKYDLSSVQTLGGGGAVFPPELARLLWSTLPHVGAGQGYGMTETVGMGTRLGGPAFKSRPETVGTGQITMKVQIRDPAGNVLPAGEVGEVYIWGAGVFHKYWNNPEATAAVLDAERWYKTGDFGRTDGEFLTLESRMRDLIIRGGENIYPIEIENRLVEHPGIADAAVIGVDHQTLGQEVKAFIVVMPGCNPSVDDIRRFAGEALAAFKVPAYVVFRDSLPYNATGKLLKRELEEQDRAASASSFPAD
ncbi:MAG TPA: class I adenylate-forming enzyme family protein [Frankiaceae bacterium]|nr:class I adenylate-forming enzyme family protein [Frankiaceae bacterium]